MCIDFFHQIFIYFLNNWVIFPEYSVINPNEKSTVIGCHRRIGNMWSTDIHPHKNLIFLIGWHWWPWLGTNSTDPSVTKLFVFKIPICLAPSYWNQKFSRTYSDNACERAESFDTFKITLRKSGPRTWLPIIPVQTLIDHLC